MNSSKRRPLAAIFLAASVAGAAACGVYVLAAAARGAEPAAGAEAKLKFIFITTCVDEDFFKPVKKGMADAARMLGVEAVFIGTPGVDVKAQAEMVRQALRDGYDGIALNIIDPEAFDAVVQEARDRGVPLVAFNVDDYATPNARLSAVCQRYYDAGRTVGRRCAEIIPAGSHILMTQHAAGVSALDDRLRGEQEELGRRGITWTTAVTGNTAAESAEVVARELNKNPRIQFVVCTGQADTEGAGLAIEAHFRERGVVAVGFDLTPEILRLVKAGIIRFTVDQQPYIQGFYPVIQLTLYQRYGILPASMDAGAAVITRDQVDSVLKLTEQQYR
ncbi:MAG: substrate-binding domain-containing protein [Candidatus Anammoximicrobium sp.]|nr:substrate-binding domain-containing protein [Candidatus Anammoximicrobium sp.]